ncbi:hypothetical protein BKA83DRAFT_4120440 [Pisolithus microcarpus]|nr:hypothetical protein BKA83DRAFT_4120427 [Pisolithus microcarpus]KAI6036754.1 hypothetical protein BKA83DRAFT_4120440 [Pisolithus microcarpus]
MSAYVVHKTLLDEHTDSVNALSFSPCGSQVNALLWHPVQKDTLICGCEDGAVFYLSDFSPTGFAGREIRLGVKDTPIFCLDLEPNTRQLVIGVGNKVHITQDGCLPVIVEFAPDQLTSTEEARGSSFHTLTTASCKKSTVPELITTNVIYRAWDVASMTALWHIRSPDIPKQIASSAVYLDLNAIVINTLHDGLYLFKLGSTKPVWRWFYECNCEAEVRYPLLVSFLHDGKAIMSGSPTGSVCIWQTKSKELYQVLPHSGEPSY